MVCINYSLFKYPASERTVATPLRLRVPSPSPVLLNHEALMMMASAPEARGAAMTAYAFVPLTACILPVKTRTPRQYASNVPRPGCQRNIVVCGQVCQASRIHQQSTLQFYHVKREECPFQLPSGIGTHSSLVAFRSRSFSRSSSIRSARYTSFQFQYVWTSRVWVQRPQRTRAGFKTYLCRL